MVFAAVWFTLVYLPVAHWVFAFDADGYVGGWIANTSARSTSPAAPPSTSTPASPPSPSSWCSARARLRHRGDAPAQPAAGAARRRPAVVRLVRLQRRLGAGAPTTPPRIAVVNTLSPPPPASRLAARREAPRRPRDHARRGLGRGRRPGRDHPGLRCGLPDRRAARRRRRRGASARWPSA